MAIYTNQQIDVEIGSSFGEIPKSEFHVFLNNTEIEYIAVVDNGAGNYTVSFNAPMENGTYGLNITVEQESVTQNIDVSQLSLQITYTDTNIGTDQLTGTRTIYYNSDNYTVGFGSESTQTNLDDGTDTLILTSNIEDGASYIFATKPNASITRTEKYLKKKEFTDLITPAFGYQIGKIHSINTLLDYDDIIIIGDVEGDVAQSGRYNLIIKNNGLTAEGKVNISVSLA